MQLPFVQDTNIFGYWQKDQHEFTHLAPVVRDRYSVPASGAGVEREFSKSGRIASWTQSKLNPKMITESMMYKSHLARQGRPIEVLEDDLERSETDVSGGCGNSKNDKRLHP